MKRNLADAIESSFRLHAASVAARTDARTWTYADLDAGSAAIARRASREGAHAGERVGIRLPRSAEALAAVVGVLRTGAAYVPLDPAWPRERLDAIARDARLRVVIDAETFPRYGRMPDGPESGSDGADPGAPLRAPDEKDMAYILYTSGSTGAPKGVCISHRAAFYFADWAAREFALGPADRVAALSPLTFDLSTFEMFSTLMSGACVDIADEATRMLPPALSRFLQERRITVVYSVPTTLRLLASRGRLPSRDLSALRAVLFAGEEYPADELSDLMRKLPEHVRYFNLYGPTETNVCTWYALPRGQAPTGPIPIGRPLPGTAVFAVREDGATVADGEEGELCVSGPGVMSGYWNNEKDARWIRRRDKGESPAYCTGDMAVRGPDGQWVFKGRRDGMVKIWGYRVELGEIEACLRRQPGVEQVSVVKADRGAPGGELVAFVVPVAGAGSAGPDVRALAAECRRALPPYMTPRRFEVLDRLPVTDSGKVDRRALVTMAQAGVEKPNE